MSQDPQKMQDYARQMRLARSRFRRINSLDLIPEDPHQENSQQTDYGYEENQHSSNNNDDARKNLNGNLSMQLKRNPSDGAMSLTKGMLRILLFWPNLLVNMILTLLRYILFVPLSVAAPSFWLSALLWIFWKLLRIPVSIVKWLINSDSLAVSANRKAAHKRTILLSSGSTIQTLHLARNFHSSGARVVVFEFEGLFGLARFSAAVDKFYVVPRPSANNVDSYIAALCHIINKEKPSVYVPVCATSPAYYDALAKSHLELLGCASFIPGLQETAVLDDCLQFYQKCATQNIPLPPHSVLSTVNDLWHLYDVGFISNFRNILMAVGMQGLLERYKYLLPNSRRDFKFNHDISERQQWMVVRDLPGDHYVTCTTVKDSRVVANVTCKIDHETKNLVPIIAAARNENHGSAVDTNAVDDDTQIQHWLRTFFAKVRFQRPINGHISFRMVKCQSTGQFLPLGVRLGVSLPYICYNRSHAQVLCRTMKCVHKRQLSFGASSSEDDLALTNLSANWSWSAIERTSATAALDKREALFAYWDPLPYCAYYHFQLPLASVKTFLQRRRRTSKSLSPRITMPVH